MIRHVLSFLFLAVATEAVAAGPDICALVPAAAVSAIVRDELIGTKPDVSEEAHSFGCSYGARSPHVSISVIRPGGSAAFDRTRGRLTKAAPVPGIGDKAVFDKNVGLITVYGDTAIDVFVPPDGKSSEQLLSIEKSLVAAVKSKL